MHTRKTLIIRSFHVEGQAIKIDFTLSFRKKRCWLYLAKHRKKNNVPLSFCRRDCTTATKKKERRRAKEERKKSRECGYGRVCILQTVAFFQQFPSRFHRELFQAFLFFVFFYSFRLKSCVTV